MMRMMSAGLFVAFAVPFAAYAANAPAVTATLAKPVSAETRLIAGGGAWVCRESTCMMTGALHLDAYKACRDIQRKLGEVTQIGSEDRPLAPSRLARCNGK